MDNWQLIQPKSMTKVTIRRNMRWQQIMEIFRNQSFSKNYPTNLMYSNVKLLRIIMVEGPHRYDCEIYMQKIV